MVLKGMSHQIVGNVMPKTIRQGPILTSRLYACWNYHVSYQPHTCILCSKSVLLKLAEIDFNDSFAKVASFSWELKFNTNEFRIWWYGRRAILPHGLTGHVPGPPISGAPESFSCCNCSNKHGYNRSTLGQNPYELKLKVEEFESKHSKSTKQILADNMKHKLTKSFSHIGGYYTAV
jgi:hypothetical protein